MKLWRTGLEKIQAYGSVHLGINVESLVEEVNKNLAELESFQQSGRTSPLIEIPSIHLIC
jgi:hypothetical protein